MGWENIIPSANETTGYNLILLAELTVNSTEY
jgi:hypothetical protein